ncbi:MAG: peptidoglycan DD-metalloendopeptidase family protein [Syntrophomonadaceae bacterium]|jgi:murein DD-endopeptidase MepM/ murein hydrolase activator NlpD|nr:peptidoglycan DD-metalloendopeptidase family protein [Syntrophomonadaceae bacterium]
MRRRVPQIIFSLLLGMVLIFCQMAPGLASTLEQKKEELSEVNSQLKERKQQLRENVKKQQDIVKELDSIEQDIAQISSDLERYEHDISRLQQSIGELESVLQEKEEALQVKTEILNKRLRDIYMQGKLSYLEVLLDSTSMSDFLTRLDFLKRLMENDAKLVKETAAERDELARKKRELEEKKEQVLSLKRATELKQNTLAARSQEREDTLKRLQADKAACERAIKELEESSRKLTQIIQQYQSKNPNPSPPQGNGSMIWPAAGPITSGYGMRIHPIYGTYSMHTGIDIGAPHGAPVKAADGGTVIYVGWMGGYGNTVVVDHGGGISTLYAHLSGFAVSSGSRVGQGQVIAYVGSTGNSTGPHLHFEVRINGHHTNPLGYL